MGFEKIKIPIRCYSPEDEIMCIDVTFFGNLSFTSNGKNISNKCKDSMNDEIVIIRAIEPILNDDFEEKNTIAQDSNLHEYGLHFVDKKIEQFFIG